jgi:hypothetical protein
MLPREQLAARHAELVAARQATARQAHEQDLMFAAALGEIERLIALMEEAAAAAPPPPEPAKPTTGKQRRR